MAYLYAFVVACAYALSAAVPAPFEVPYAVLVACGLIVFAALDAVIG